jgi:hypothetical protein
LTDDEFRWIAAQAANAALLTENDLPANYDPVPPVQDEGDGEPSIELTGECSEFNDLLNVETNFVNAVAEAETGEFKNENEDAFSSNAGVFRDAALAEAEASRYQRFVASASCTDQFKAAFRAYADEVAATEALTITTWLFEIQEISVPVEGDWGHGMRMAVAFAFSDGRGVDYKVDTVASRVGRLIGTVEYTYSGEPDIALRDAIFDTIASRLTAQDQDLPG